MRSLKGEDSLAKEADDTSEELDIRPLQLRRRWERRSLKEYNKSFAFIASL